MRYIRAPIIVFMLLFLMVPSAFAAYTADDALRDFSVDAVDTVFADNGGTHQDGTGVSQTTTDTRTPEQIADDNRRQQVQELEEKIQGIVDQLNSNPDMSQEEMDDLWGELPDMHDWLENGGSLPEWGLPEWDVPDLQGLEQPDLDALWRDFLESQGIDPDIPIDTLINGRESSESDFDGSIAIPTGTGAMSVTQQVLPLEVLALRAGALATLDNPPSTDVPDASPIDIRYREDDTTQIPDMNTDPGLPDIDWQALYDDFIDYVREHLPTWENPDIPQNDFLDGADPDQLQSLFPNLNRDTIPGTDIEVTVPNNQEELYELLLFYLEQLHALGISNVNVTKFTVYQIDSASIQTIRTSTPLPNYRWMVYDNASGDLLVEKSTTESYAKLLFRGEGIYKVRVYNTRNVIRNNQVRGEKTELWVLSMGGVLDGLVVYKTLSQFSAYISDNIGPTTEEIELVQNGFTANVTPSMLNTIVMVDDSGNIRTPSNSFTTQRGKEF